jgi:hypothetical protein
MPELAHSMLPHWCVVWTRSDTQTKHGRPRLGSPTDVRCRWTTADQASSTQDNFQETYPRHLPVGQDIGLGSFVWGPGRVRDLPASPQYYEVVGKQKVPDVKGRNYAYIVNLQKASKTLPDLA